MDQTRLHIDCTQEEARRLSPVIEQAFEEEGYTIATFETDSKTGRWSLSLYVPAHALDATQARLVELAAANGVTAPASREELPKIDWVSRTLLDLKPVRAGRYIVHGSHDRAAPRAGDIAIEIDAGLAFGTGHHGTTAGCLEMLARSLKARRFRRALDLGTGSGVLAIALARTPPFPPQGCVLASDIDPVSVVVARANCRLNRVAGRVDLVCAAGLGHRRFSRTGPFDLVVANILAGPLQAMARDVVRHVAPGGTVILSGLLPHQKARIVASYRMQGLVYTCAHLRDGWLTLVMRKP
ncbi:MAG: 50S ribosomal protein L11 methyltransferase [Pseudomonadota bacterium]|nr:50S ribosomal protein L11 methyltransferase [Pseudomonadota bacterium]